MTTDLSTQPFRELIHDWHYVFGVPYADMPDQCDAARSAAWFNNLVLYGPWEGPSGRVVAPPGPAQLPGLAKMLNRSTSDLKAMIARDWYGVIQNPGLSARVSALQQRLNALDDRDAALVESLVQRLAWWTGELAKDA